jgi:3-oxoacyl-[acyl-carrier protein] reductase
MNIVITGATDAIGSALATLLDARGETLFLCGRSEEKLEALNQVFGGAHHTVATDLTDAAGCAVLQEKAMQLGGIGGLAHCVGSTVVRPLHLTSEKDWH